MLVSCGSHGEFGVSIGNFRAELQERLTQQWSASSLPEATVRERT